MNSEKISNFIEQHWRPPVTREETQALFDQLSLALITSTIMLVWLMAVLWLTDKSAHPDPTWLLVWFGALIWVLVVRLRLRKQFKQVRDQDFDPLWWAHRYTKLGTLSGLVTGVGGACVAWILFENVPLMALLAMTFVLMSLGSTVVHAAFRPAHLAYVMPMLLLVGGAGLLRGGWFLSLQGLFCFGMIYITYRLALKKNQDLVESIQLRLENAKLVVQLKDENQIAEAARKQAELANAAKTRFFAAASHDLRQPAQAIELFAAALFNDAPDEPSRRAATNILSGMRELMGMIESLLDFVRIDTATLVPTVGQVSMAELSMHMRTEFTAQAAKLGLKFRVARCRHTWVQSDRVMLERMVRNLIHNALRYTPNGKVLLGYRRVGEHLRIEVHDTGIGIAPEKQAQVFEEFVQLGNPERDHKKGLGLGLAIVSGLSRILDHPIKLCSKPGVGTLFSITVPLVSKPNLPIPELVYVPQKPETANVLVIDDDERVRESMTGLLRTWGYTVKAVDSAVLAVQMMENTGFDPDVLLLDYRLRHGLTAIDAVDQIHEFLGYKVPALVMTGNTEPEVKDKLAQHGLSVVYKPVSSVKLREVLATMLA